MTPEQQRIAIAEACPNVIRRLSDPTVWQYNQGGYWMDCIKNNPLNDLNACHEALSVLTEEQRNAFLRKLEIVVDDTIPGGWLWACVNATADQRCEAFLRTLNLWTD